uniref:Proton-coupled zinc antiporter SLC30A9, mitochondrial n=1 Tax=Spongospora subterranea TaxID=70186 RepID=A0A0H5R5R4_9EUKA|eukprot:CRZ09495.1 hypothetical protein [Spongospora subterranea]
MLLWRRTFHFPRGIPSTGLSLLPRRQGIAFASKSSVEGPFFLPETIDDATGWIPRGAAIRRYCLNDSDLDSIEHIEKPNPYMPSSRKIMRLYRHGDVYAKAIQRYGSMEAVASQAANEHTKLVDSVKANSANTRSDDLNAHSNYRHERKLPARLNIWARTFDISATSSGKVVAAAIVGNFSVSLSKFVAAWFTCSASMLSEGIHSLADLSNQCLLAIGLSESYKTPDALHPYGYASEKYVWALISGVGIFFLGCGVSLYHGVLGIINPIEIVYHPITPAVLWFSFCVETATLAIALQEIQKAATKLEMTTLEYIKRGPDPNTVAVVAEDAAAVCGILIAGSCIGLTHYTGLAIFDACGSIIVGGLLGVVAMFLIRKNHEYLLGRSIHHSYTDKVLKVLHESEVISSVHDVKAVFLGPDAFRFKAEIVVNGQILSKLFLAQHRNTVSSREEGNSSPLMLPTTHSELEAALIEFGDHLMHFLGDEIDQIEAEIKRTVPEIKHVDLEVI